MRCTVDVPASLPGSTLDETMMAVDPPERRPGTSVATMPKLRTNDLHESRIGAVNGQMS